MTREAKTLSVSINRAPDEVYAFIVNPENFPKWAPGFCKSVRNVRGEWIAETTLGDMKIRFVAKNQFRVADHYVTSSDSKEFYSPMRVLPNSSGSEVLFTVFRQPDYSDEQFRNDWGVVQRDLEALKSVLEK